MSEVSVQQRYSTGAMVFHWVIAVLVIMNWQIAERAGDLEGADRMAVMGYHKAWGITILVLTLARLAWRLSHRVPPLPASMAGWEKTLARTVHTLFYVLLIGLPLGGWLASSFFAKPVDIFGLFALPALPVGENPALGKAIFDAHGTGGTVLLALVALHVLGALKHTFFDRSGGIFRMLPFGRVERS